MQVAEVLNVLPGQSSPFWVGHGRHTKSVFRKTFR